MVGQKTRVDHRPLRTGSGTLSGLDTFLLRLKPILLTFPPIMMVLGVHDFLGSFLIPVEKEENPFTLKQKGKYANK